MELNINKKDISECINFDISLEYNYKSIYDSKNINISEMNHMIVILNKTLNKILYLFKGPESFYLNRPSMIISDDKYYNYLNINEHLNKFSSITYKDFLIYLLALNRFEVNNETNMIIKDSNIVLDKDIDIKKIVKIMLDDFLYGLNKEEKTITILLINLYVSLIFDLHYKYMRIKDNTTDLKEKELNKIYRKSIFEYLEMNFQVFNKYFYSNNIFDIQKCIFFKKTSSDEPSYAFRDDFPYIKNEIELNLKEKIEDIDIINTITLLNRPIDRLINQRNKNINQIDKSNILINKLYKVDNFFQIVDKKYDIEHIFYTNNSTITPFEDIFNEIFNTEEMKYQKSISIESEKIEKDINDNIIKKESNISIFTQKIDTSNNMHKGTMDEKINNMIGKKHDLIYITNKEYIKDIKIILDNKFPWMKEANETIVKSLILNFKLEKHISLRNIILEGKSGIGKSYYIATLAKLLELPYVSYKVGGKAEFLDFTGNSSNWGGSKPSLMTKMVLNHNILNPLIVVDELDKALNNHHGDLQDSLLSLLDKNEAKNFFDPYLSYNVDFSRFNWIFTINNKSSISRYLLDRSKVLKIEEPKEEHFDLIYDNIIQELSLEEGISMEEISRINIPKNNLYEKFKVNYSLRKTKEYIYDYIDNYYYNEFFKKPNLNIL